MKKDLMKQIILSSILLLSLTAYSQALPKIEAAENTVLNLQQAEAPVYKTGETWTYRAIDKPIGSSTSNVLNGDFEITFQGGSRKIFRLDGGAKAEESNPGVLNLMLPTKGIIESDSHFFSFPIAVGKKWKAEYYAPGWSRRVNAESSVTGIETVTGPAGVFPAFKIERQSLILYRLGGDNGVVRYFVTFVIFTAPKPGAL